jgi:hypothetical protein
MVEPRLARAYGTLAGFGFVGAALMMLPSTRLLEPAPAPEAYLLTLLSLVTGLVCLAVPWDLIDPRWLHLIGAAAIAETAATVAVFGQLYVALFFLIGVLVAYIAPDGRTLAVQLGLICAAVVGPILYGPDSAKSSLAVALVVVPVLLVTTLLFSYLRLKMVHDRRAYHRFAEQTMTLSSQIAGRPLGPLGLAPQPEPIPWLSGIRPPVGALAACAAVLGIPLLTGGLAAAGVKLPGPAAAAFESVGIELPNQEDSADGATSVSGTERRATVRRTRVALDGSESPAPGENRERDNSRRTKGDGGGGASQDGASRGTSGAPATSSSPIPSLPTVPGASSGVNGGGGGGGGGGDGGGNGGGPVRDLLGDASEGLQGVFAELQANEKKK